MARRRQRLKGVEVKQAERATYDPWDFYWPDTIQAEACDFYPWRVVEFLEAAQLGKTPRRLNVAMPRDGDEFAEFHLLGWAPDPLIPGERAWCEFKVRLYKNELSDTEKKRVMNALRQHYPARVGPPWQLKCKVAKALGTVP